MRPTHLLHRHITLSDLRDFHFVFFLLQNPSPIQILCSHYFILLGVVIKCDTVKRVNDLAGGELEPAVGHDEVPCLHKEVAFVDSLDDAEVIQKLLDENDLVDVFVEA